MPRLFTHNVQVDKWNEFQLSGLPGDGAVLESVQTGPDHQRAFLVKNLLTPATLRLKPGALVMFTVNKSEPGRKEPLFVNGQIGSVEAVEPGAVVVRCKDGEPIRVERFTWRYDAQESRAVCRAGEESVERELSRRTNSISEFRKSPWQETSVVAPRTQVCRAGHSLRVGRN